MGEHVFGGLAKALRDHPPSPATVVRMVLPPTAQELAFRPFDLAHLDGRTFAELGYRFVYQVGAPATARERPRGRTLRVLLIFRALFIVSISSPQAACRDESSSSRTAAFSLFAPGPCRRGGSAVGADAVAEAAGWKPPTRTRTRRCPCRRAGAACPRRVVAGS